MNVRARSHPQMLSRNCSPCFMRSGLSLAPEDPRLGKGWLFSKSQGLISFFLLNTGTSNIQQHIWVLMCVLGMELRLACLYSMCFTNWTVFQPEISYLLQCFQSPTKLAFKNKNSPIDSSGRETGDI